MTNDEALKILPDMKGAGDDWDKAIDLAIEALNNSNTLKSLDCVDRRGVIDHLKSITVATSIGNKYNEGFVDGLDFAVGYLKIMPSVQPDIIACGDCKHYIPHNKRCGYWNHGVKPLEWCSQAERWWKE